MTSTGSAMADPASPLIQTNRKRCWECRKKVGLTGIECRCEYVFCGSCRFPDKHACSFDHKAHGRATLAKQNPVVAASKLDSI